LSVTTDPFAGLHRGSVPADTPPSTFEGSATEWNVRVDLAACYRMIAHCGWDDLIATHMSARVPDEDDAFLINNFGLLFDEVTASSLVKVNLAGETLEDRGANVNPAGFTIHSAVYQTRKDAGAVIHLHTLDGMAVSTHVEGLLPLTQTAMTVWADIAYHDFEGSALDLAEREHLQRDLGSKNIMILRNHGTLSVGDSIPSAFIRIFQLENACTAQVRALAAGSQLTSVDPEAITKTIDPTGKNMRWFGKFAWPAVRRKMDRVDPSYRD
jgi:ribulose-5-phosphate 4-epimerase/fuculose-1-phosphate aldolase